MSVILIHPNLTIGNDTVAESFYHVLRTELEEHTDVRGLKTAMHLHSVSIQSDEVLIIFNKQTEDYSQNVLYVLRQALETNCTIIPVSLYQQTRSPADMIGHIQSFDVVDQLRQRRLTEKNRDTVAFSLTRLIMSKVQPTMSVERMDLFISHRRADGEEIAAEFYNEFRKRVNEVETFRDLISIKVGQNAQEEIEKSLYKSDAVIFIDTPLCGESIWVEKELQIALGLNLPIIWVKVGAAENRVELKVIPGGSPHYKIENSEINDLESSNLIDDIIHKAFQLSRTNAMTVIDHFNRIQQLASSKQINLIPINKKNMIYRVEIPRVIKGLNYYQRPLSHVFQLFGRNPKDEDRNSFEPLISDLGFLLHPDLGYHFDSGLLLGPSASLSTVPPTQPICIDSVDEYVTSLQKYLSSDKNKTPKKGIIISGAFPDYEPEFQQQLTDAVFSFSKAVLDKGGIVIFGSHPTFQHLILDLARRQRPDDYINAVHMYISKYFVTQATINELTNKATIYATDNIKDNRAESLTSMRKAMISDEEVAGIVLLGGKQHVDIKPGIDEELELAKHKGIPAFIIGSVGGRSSELAQEMIESGGKSINTLTKEQNHKLLTSLDYRSLADEILQTLGF
ncbi:TIR domain-containing protein [Paenibacillus sp. 1781tsa1]|uniref:SLOG domain-containing protein n=1 Tax=Paenibacillus sp. 1781tsa1 TaxID=2953810 RepID=UPI00209C94C2|nr:TIR domain-containing protein [Paenibacillus sp. 1781tsa1]MCP1186038.1 TIR domain-containing protein [Paenibacillus sp. 1781tsa1]